MRFHGDLVACVVATDRAIADDAAERVRVDYEPLPPVTSIDAALAPGAPRVDDALPDNLVSHQSFSPATRTAASPRRTAWSRPASCNTARPTLPMEPRGCCAIWDEGRQHLTMHVGTQVPHPYRTQLAARLGLTESQVTVICPDIGGGFGQKITLYREELTVAALARALRRPVRWREERGENLLAAAHAREQTAEVRAAADADGAHHRPVAGDYRGFRRLLLLPRQLPAAHGGPEPDRPVSHHRLCRRHAGGADQQMRRRADARADVDRKLGHGRHASRPSRGR